MLNTKEKLKVALGEPLRKKIGGQEFEFYPLDVTYLPDFFELYGKLEGKTDEVSVGKIFGDRANSKIIVDLIVAMVKESMPKDTDEKLINQFCMKYFVELQEILVDLHKPSDSVDQIKLDRLKEIRERKAKAKKKEENVVKLS